MTFRSKVLALTKKYDGQTDGRTDGQTDGHPKPIGPQPFGLGPKKPHNHIDILNVCLNFLFGLATVHKKTCKCLTNLIITCMRQLIKDFMILLKYNWKRTRITDNNNKTYHNKYQIYHVNHNLNTFVRTSWSLKDNNYDPTIAWKQIHFEQ